MANGVKQGGVISPIFFSLYIDPLLYDLMNSGYGCHIKDIYMGVLSYADDITILCPSMEGLNEMLKICDTFARNNSIIFNSKKTLCIKFGHPVVRNEVAIFKGESLQWVDKVRHLGNLINNTCTDLLDCNFKRSMFIGYVNKLRCNYGKVQYNVLINLFKSYCCSFYGSQLWRFNSNGFDKCCKAWNTAVRILLNLPYNAHTWILGPLLSQSNIRDQFYIRNFKLLWYASRSHNIIIKTCIENAINDSNTGIGYKFAFYRYMYDLDMTCDLRCRLLRISKCRMSDNQVYIVSNVSTLLSARSGPVVINGFTLDDINCIINSITVE